MKIIAVFDKAKSILSRQAGQNIAADDDREKTVRQIVNDVRQRGDAALFDYTRKFDGVKLTSLEIDNASINRAYRGIDKELLAVMKLAAERITAYHLEQKKKFWQENTKSKLGWLIRPLRSVGVHVPGFSAPLPSSLLMTAIPAKVAGVKEIILVTPPQSDGKVSPVTLAAAKMAGVDRVFSVGGAQAIAALAFGTGAVPAGD